jgi:hypothetical protein
MENLVAGSKFAAWKDFGTFERKNCLTGSWGSCLVSKYIN